MDKQHNLNIAMYSLEDIFQLFDITYDISVDDLKRAKKKVLMLHPDKSRLSPDYFLFYKKAFDIVVRFYENQSRQNKVVPTEKVDYVPVNPNDHNKSTAAKISTTIRDMAPGDFQSKFNKLFEDNMYTKPDPSRNAWFTKDEPTFQADEPVNSKNMGRVFETLKQKQSALVQHRGVENLYVNSGSGTRLYEDDEDEGGQYISSDPFSKLKFEDLRKVHKDQTILSVGESDFKKVKQYQSADHFMRERGAQVLTPLEKQESEMLLMQKERAMREAMMKKEHAASLKTMEYADKNKKVLSSFLLLHSA
jgi:hypothetical protein